MLTVRERGAPINGVNRCAPPASTGGAVMEEITHMFDTNAEAAAVGNYVDDHSTTIINALEVFAANMAKAAEAARQEYRKGQTDAHVKARQDISMLTNNGYRQTAGLFDEQADIARRVAVELGRLIDGEDVEDIEAARVAV